VLYLSVFEWPSDGKLVIPGLKNELRNVTLISDRKKLKTEATADGVTVFVPRQSPDPVASVIRVEIKGTMAGNR